jgi:hypothetical protein
MSNVGFVCSARDWPRAQPQPVKWIADARRQFDWSPFGCSYWVAKRVWHDLFRRGDLCRKAKKGHWGWTELDGWGGEKGKEMMLVRSGVFFGLLAGRKMTSTRTWGGGLLLRHELANTTCSPKCPLRAFLLEPSRGVLFPEWAEIWMLQDPSLSWSEVFVHCS